MRKLLGVLLLFGVAGCGGPDAPEPPVAGMDNSVAVARIGERTISEADIDAEFAAMPEQFRKLKDNPAMRANLLNSMLDRYALLEKARAMGIANEPAVRYRIEVNEAAILRQEIDRRQLGNRPDEQAVTAYYAANQQRFNLPERVHVRHILVKEEAEAKKLLAKLKNGGDFAKLAMAHSIDMGSKGKGGELPPFSEGMMEPAFSQAAFALQKANALAGPVKSPFGYHVIQLIERLPAGQQSMEEARPQIERELQQLAAQAWMEQARAELGVQVLNPAYQLNAATAGEGKQ